MADLSKTAAWAALMAHGKTISATAIRDLFAQEPSRLDWSVCEGAGLTLDFSKNQIDRKAVDLLITLAEERDLSGWRGRMAAGEPINLTEGRAALHMALRSDTNGAAAENRSRFLAFAEAVREGRETSASGDRFNRIVHIGIGGSDLGPRLVTSALKHHQTGDCSVRFVANVDAEELTEALDGADARNTLFLVASKSFTTQETVRNARTAREWLEEALPDGSDPTHHFAALTAAPDAARAFGISDNRIFPFHDWVGGRFSVWSSVGTSAAIAIGVKGFEEFLAGAAEMDQHFLTAPFVKNLPVLLALVGIWNRDVLGMASHAILPYAHALSLLPAYLQQLEMESNGKSVQRDGAPVQTSTAPAVWGGSGTTGQHAFYQWLHQGTDRASCDILLALAGEPRHPTHHDILLSHGIAQAEALAFGRDEAATRAALDAEGLNRTEIERLLPHRTFTGNRPVSVLTLDRLTPRRLGALLALYEHKVFTQGVLWDINSFDQWGVELGKSLAGRVLAALAGRGDATGLDPSTRRLIEAARAARSTNTSET